MSDELSAQLREAARSGVYRAAAVAPIEAAARGLALARIDLAGARDKAAALERVARALGFPEWFGGNWDALEDCLTDLSWREAAGHVLVFEGAASLGADERGILTDILASVASYWAGRGRPFFAVFVGGAPGLPELGAGRG